MQMFGLSSLIVMLALAVLSDLGTRRIPNALVYGGLALAVSLRGLQHGGAGVLDAVSGSTLAALPLLILWMLGGMAAGDVKLMAAAGAFLGPAAAIVAMLATLIVGGIFAVGAWASHGRSGTAACQRRMPYAPAIAAGCVYAVFRST